MTELSVLPSGWLAVPLRDVADVQLGKMLSAKSRSGRGARPYLRNANVRWGRIDVDDVLHMDFSAREVEKYTLRDGDVLVCEGGEPGRAAVWRNQLPGALYQKALHRVRFPGGIVDPRYLVYHLEFDARAHRLSARFTGSTIDHLPREAFLEYELRVPPRAEQHRIIAAIEERLSTLGAAVAGLERARANIRRYRAASTRAAVDGSLLNCGRQNPVCTGPDPWLPTVPEHWCWATVDELAEVVEYGTSSKTQESGDIPVLRMGNIVDGDLHWDKLKYLPASHGEFPRLLLLPGDVLFNRTNSPELVGKCAVYRAGDPVASFASYLLRVRLGSRMLPQFFAAFVNSVFGRAWVANVVSQQVGQANVNGTKLRALHVPVPPLTEQHAIVTEVEQRLAVSGRTIAEIDVQLARAARLRQSILKRAFEGKLAPQDSNEEATSALMERIRAEREGNNGKANGSQPRRVRKRSAH